ncbi:hypothetical protein STCU_01147 [Strigomonas culicis]|uniref:Succinate dehydrogenase subunit n=1 Tax=Strigomonas culicis TaxID=28005 RepID=S9UXB1_9TRYP|nr:hypothetical protein STCU_06398 [Strigomonas culicis]EPY26631.1 hypothetical protein STCU_06158 [Strigomonas culicis]EPY35527.1 hypothetical protein STCU_01147 [Strigomonas culicis]|eukprot:EPY25945.1 hypothetical protein STCU_06398 [Strigomonas culicis]
MRRIPVCAGAAVASLAAASTHVTPARPIYTTWGSTAQEAWTKTEGWLQRITSQDKFRSFDFWHVPEADMPEGLYLNSVETYLLSAIENDTERLLNVSWGYDFDPFWHDRVESHNMLFKTIYENQYPIYRFIFGNCSDKEAEMLYIQKKLNYLKSVLFWAARTERRYTSIAKARYEVQRNIFNALERERYLCACVEAVDSFREKVPEEFREKAMGELEVHLVNMRHWVFDCPNGKRTFTRRLA